MIKPGMHQAIAHVTLLVRDYDEALAFYVGLLGFRLLEDTALPEQNKRWVVVAPPGAQGTSLLLRRAARLERQALEETVMTVVDTSRSSTFWLYLSLFVIFFACLWVGWRRMALNCINRMTIGV